MTLGKKTKPMSAKKILSFLGSALMSVLAIYLAFAFLMIMTFSLRGQTLHEVENEKLLFLAFWTLLAVIGGFVAFLFWRKRKNYSASGVGIVAVFPLFGALLMAYKSLSSIPVTDDFVAEVWGKSDVKPFLMAKDVVKSNVLLGKSEDELLAILTDPSDIIERSYSESTFIYQTDSSSWIMRVNLANHQVQSSDLYHPGLSN